jgi:glucoamylase
MKIALLILGFVLFSAQAAPTPAETTSAWAQQESQIAYARITDNISSPGTASGSVIASPSKADPDYYYHWTRDSALTLDALVTVYQTSTSPQIRNQLAQIFKDFLSFSRKNQETATLTGLGEPRFNVDGSAYNGPWSRPQNDGPALRAITATHLAFIYLREGHEDFVRRALYDGTSPTQSLIKTDLEYVSRHWRDSCFDLWEETRGDHFYTRMVQRRALIEGAQLARILGDGEAADFYASQALEIGREMAQFWNADTQLWQPTIHWTEGSTDKKSGLDVAVLLAVLHGDAGDGFLPASDPSVILTAQRLTEVFSKLYAVNRIPGAPGVAIGRYPEDVYSGTPAVGGNPWIIATAAVGEIYFRAATELRDRDPVAAQRYRQLGEEFLRRIQYHASADGSMSEQWNRDTGLNSSARDLTWSYASFLTLMDARAR